MRINRADFIRLSEEKSLRMDYTYQMLLYERSILQQEYYTFDDLFCVAEEKVMYSDIEGEFRYCQIGDVGKDGSVHPVKLNFDARSLLDENYYRKIEKGDIMRVEEGDILISFLLPQDPGIPGKFTRIREGEQDILFSTAFLRIKAKKCPHILYYCLQSLFYRDLVYTARIRKGYTGYATLSRDDLKYVRFRKSVVDRLFHHQDTLSASIMEIEDEMKRLNDSTLTDQSIIDAVFQREFDFNYARFEELKAHRNYAAKQSLFSNNPDLRFSAKYHRPAGDFVKEQLAGLTDKKIKHFLAEPIVLGASISPSDYDENGEFSYISMAAIKTWTFDAENAAAVSDRYAAAKAAKTVQKNDIILARSGEGTIGKAAIITDENVRGIFADFTMRIRLRDYNSQFAYYYFRTMYFQYLIEIYKKGLGNNTNIFPIVIQEFPVPDISLKEQERIVCEIQTEIHRQAEIKNQIAELRNRIDRVIAEAVSM